MFYLYMPSLVLIAAAVIPAAVLLALIYREDRVEREPAGLLASLVLRGVIATSVAKALEYVGMALVDAVAAPGTLLSEVLMYFVVVGFAEEGAKYALLKRRTWAAPEFNCQFDGVVYAVFVSLGFALWENIGYVLMHGMGTAMLRAVTAVPGHAAFGVFMGCFYSQARAWAELGDARRARACLAAAVVVPALLHGAYDFLASYVAYNSGWYFVGFVAALFLVTLRLTRRLSAADRFI